MIAASQIVRPRHAGPLRRSGWSRALACGLGLWAGLVAAPATAATPELWFYYDANLGDPREPERLENVWTRAAAAGYRFVVLADPKLGRLGEMGPDYFANLERARTLAGRLGIEIVPLVFEVGRSNRLLVHDPNLAEGLPVRNAPFVVRGGVAVPVATPKTILSELPDGHDRGFQVTRHRATVTDAAGRARLWFKVAVEPFQVYRVRTRIRTQEYGGEPLIQVVAGPRSITFHRDLEVAPTQAPGWREVVFNSLDHREVQVFMGSWEAGKGTIEWSDWTIAPAGPVNVLRRAGLEFRFTGYREGRDFAPVVDSLLGADPWRGQFHAAHPAPVIRTRLPEGTRLAGSWHHAALVYDDQVSCCLAAPEVEPLLRDESQRVLAALAPARALVSYSEIRAAGWDDACSATGLAPGALLARHVRAARKLLERQRIYVWNDAFDPYHNAREDQYFVRGSLAGSWEGLSPDVTVVNWNFDHPAASLRFFAERGHRQILAAYYDGDPDAVADRVQQAQSVRGIEGVMYATWRRNFEDLERFAGAARRAWR